MPLVSNSYGKGRVRVMRVVRDGERHEVREVTALTMLEGDFARAYTDADNAQVIATDTIKNITYVVAREKLAACNEVFGETLACRFLSRYPQVSRATVTLHETKWARATAGGGPHGHSFTLDANGAPYARISATRDGVAVTSGITGYTFMKSTAAGWVGYVIDDATTLPETTDRLVATAMDATWTWRATPVDYPASNAAILAAMLEVFATTYSHSVQDSLLRMGEAALSRVAEVQDITMACPNKHYLPARLEPFGLSADNMVFIPTDEPHGQIECTVGRGTP